MASFWAGKAADGRRSWARPANLRGLCAVSLMLVTVLGTTSVGAARALAQGVPSTAAGPPGIGLAWGSNASGQSGDGTTTDSSIPVAVDLPVGTTITALAGGGLHSLALTSAGTVLAWGGNGSGQLGDGTTTDSSTPVAVDLPVGTTITAIAAGNSHSLALTSAGTVLAWGYNNFGQLGDGTTTDSSTPVAVDLPVGTTITALAGGGFHSLALTSAGAVLAWGTNGSGQLGDGTNTNSSIPVAVDLPVGTTITALAGGRFHSLAVTSVGAGLAWGLNDLGQLGDGTTTDSSIPVAVDLPVGTMITAVAAGDRHSLALTSAGTVLAWGLNATGQLGDGTTTNSSSPVAVDLPVGTTITAVAGAVHSLALTSAGAVLAWGANDSGQLGDGTTVNSSSPVAVDLPAGTTITAIAGGGFHSLAIVRPTSTTTLQASPPNPKPDQLVTLAATVTCTGGTPTGTVTFLDGTKVLGTEPLSGSPTATATRTVTHLTPGTHSIQARYNGDDHCPASTSNPTAVMVRKPILPVTGVRLPAILAVGFLLTLTGAALAGAFGRTATPGAKR
ncbi:RCC1 domain-containing protein [Salinispora fenicalii]|uniref:RCC1 domain-containing protein n=1 Tax=Salinispora fenicalii TaxID=1137263 RepID=UPI000487EAF1|nr:Ig-like domain repeat protein [Salinispora fenicalii]